MKNLTRQFRRALANGERNYLAYADITLVNDTIINLTNSELWSDGFSYEEAISEDENFTALGSAIIGSAEIIINNIDEEYSSYDFTNARVVLYLGMQFADRLEKFKVGTYQVDDTVYNGATVKLSLLDNMEQFDRPYSLSTLHYPATLSEIVRNACTTCGVTLANDSLTFPHYTYSISTRPNDESLTFREVLSWVATLAGCFLKCNPDGQLTLKWFDVTTLDNIANDLDGGTFNPWTSGDLYDGGTFNPWSDGTIYDEGELSTDRDVHYLSQLTSQNIAMDDTVITGVVIRVKDESENASQDILEYVTGTTDYAIEIENNEFITKTNASTILNWLGTQLIGLRFRKLNVSQLNDPSIESGDISIVIDKNQNVYRALITRMTFSVSSEQTIVCGSSTPSRNSASRFSAATKSYVESRKLLRREQTAREQAIEQLEQAIEESSGLYTTIVTQQTGGNIYYLHDASTLAESKVVWKMTRDAWAVTDDWQGTDEATTEAHKWNAGLTVDGTLIAEILAVSGINADWINTGTITIGGTSGNINGSLVIKDANGNTIGTFNKNGISVKGSIQSGSSISGASISGGTISGASVTIGGSGASGSLVVKDSSNNTLVSMDKYGATFKGSIQSGSSISGASISGGSMYSGVISGPKIVFDDFNNVQFLVQESVAGVGNLLMNGIVLTRPASVSSDTVDNQAALYNGVLNIGKGTVRKYGSAADPANYKYTFDWNTRFVIYYDAQDRLYVSCPTLAYPVAYLNCGLTVSGTKSRVVKTSDNNRLAYCYEMASPIFGDIGSAVIGSDGKVIIDIDSIFQDFISDVAEYYVFLQNEGLGESYVSEKHSTYFIVQGTPNLKISWELKGRQVDYNYQRLEYADENFDFNDINYEEDAFTDVMNYLNGGTE